MSNRDIVIVGAIVAAVWLAWMLRFDMHIHAGGQGNVPAGYVLDRWTGAVHFIAPSGRRELSPIQ